MFNIFKKHILGIFVSSFIITLAILSFVLVSHAEEYDPQVKGASTSDVRPVLIIDNGIKMTAYCSGETFDEIFDELGITYWPEDKIKVFPDPALGIGTKITIRRATPVVIVNGLKTIKLRTWSNTVSEVLSEKKIKLGDLDRINFEMDKELTNNIKIVIVRVKEKTVTETELISYETERRDDPETIKGKEYISQYGKNGKKEVEYRVTYENGKEIKREKIGEKIIKQSKTQIVMVGTRPIVTVACGGYDSAVALAASRYGVSADNMCKCMWLESQFNPYAVGGGGTWYGLFQYSKSTWSFLSCLSGHCGESIYNSTAQIWTTAWAWGHGQCGRWPSCPCP